jgi:hypothetical protein
MQHPHEQCHLPAQQQEAHLHCLTEYVVTTAVLSKDCCPDRRSNSPCSTRSGGDGVDALHREVWHRHGCHRVGHVAPAPGCKGQVPRCGAWAAVLSCATGCASLLVRAAAQTERALLTCLLSPALCKRQVMCCSAAGCVPSRAGLCRLRWAASSVTVNLERATISCSAAEAQYLSQQLQHQARHAGLAHRSDQSFTA